MRLLMLHAKLGLLDEAARRLRSLPTFLPTPNSRRRRITKVAASYAQQLRVPLQHAYIWDALYYEQFFLCGDQPDAGATAKLMAYRLACLTDDPKAAAFYGLAGYQRWVT